MTQEIIEAEEKYDLLDTWFRKNNVRCALLVCGKSIERLRINDYMDQIPKRLGVKIVRFMDFQPNPDYESAVKGVHIFRARACDAIIAVGGGSAIDVAKCIKLFSNMDGDGADGAYLRQSVHANKIPFLSMPTTSGTGSEATRYAVIYYDGIKQSVSDYSCIPSTVLMDACVLKTLPAYQKKATMMDALCHAIESFWSVNSTEESRRYSRRAIEQVLANMEGYLANTKEGNTGMLYAANTAGKAINITQTTAGHAMCYKITTLFGCAHGHAAALCNRALFPWMINNLDKCIDPRGDKFLKAILTEIADSMRCDSVACAVQKLNEIVCSLSLEIPKASEEQFIILKNSVNPERLKNFPIKMDTDTIDKLYHDILRC